MDGLSCAKADFVHGQVFSGVMDEADNLAVAGTRRIQYNIVLVIVDIVDFRRGLTGHADVQACAVVEPASRWTSSCASVHWSPRYSKSRHELAHGGNEEREVRKSGLIGGLYLWLLYAFAALLQRCVLTSARWTGGAEGNYSFLDSLVSVRWGGVAYDSTPMKVILPFPYNLPFG